MPWLDPNQGWRVTNVTIQLPTQGILTAEERVQFTQRHKSLRKDGLLLDMDGQPNAEAPMGIPFRVLEMCYRPLTDVIKHVWSKHPTSHHFHLQPFKQYIVKDWSKLSLSETLVPTPLMSSSTPHPNTASASTSGMPTTRLPERPPPLRTGPYVPTPPQPSPSTSLPQQPFPDSHPHLHADDFKRVHGELYSSDSFLEVHADLQNLKWKIQHSPMPHELKTCMYEWTVAMLMVYSDATMPYTFSNLKLWPIYIYFGNLSKYFRCQPTANAVEHIAYIPGVRYSRTHFITIS
jgi:hypothetical protein